MTSSTAGHRSARQCCSPRGCGSRPARVASDCGEASQLGAVLAAARMLARLQASRTIVAAVAIAQMQRRAARSDTTAFPRATGRARLSQRHEPDRQPGGLSNGSGWWVVRGPHQSAPRARGVTPDLATEPPDRVMFGLIDRQNSGRDHGNLTYAGSGRAEPGNATRGSSCRLRNRVAPNRRGYGDSLRARRERLSFTTASCRRKRQPDDLRVRGNRSIRNTGLQDELRRRHCTSQGRDGDAARPAAAGRAFAVAGSSPVDLGAQPELRPAATQVGRAMSSSRDWHSLTTLRCARPAPLQVIRLLRILRSAC